MRFILLLLVCFGHELIAQPRIPATPLGKFIDDNTRDITTDPIRSCRTLDSLYQVLQKDPAYRKDTFIQRVLSERRMGACFNAIKPLSEMDQSPRIIIDHCLKVKKILYETEKNEETIVNALLYLNGMLALTYERNGEHRLAIELKKDFDPYLEKISDALFFEYIRFLQTLVTNYRVLTLYEEGFSISQSIHQYFESILEKNIQLPSDIELLLKRYYLSSLQDMAALKESMGNLSAARVYFATCQKKALEWKIIDLSYFMPQISFLGRIGEYEEQDKAIVRLEEEIRKTLSTRSIEYVSLLTTKAMIQVDMGNYQQARSMAEEAREIGKELDLPFFLKENIKEVLITVLEEEEEEKEFVEVIQSLIEDHRAFYGKSPTIIRLLLRLSMSRLVPNDRKIAALTEAENLAMEYKDTLALVNVFEKMKLFTTSEYVKVKNQEGNVTQHVAFLQTLCDGIIYNLRTATLQKDPDFFFYLNSVASTYILLRDYKKALSIINSFRVDWAGLILDHRLQLYETMANLHGELGNQDSCYFYGLKLSGELKNNVIDRNFLLVESGFEKYHEVNRYFEYLDRIIVKQTKPHASLIGLTADNAIFRKSLYLNSTNKDIRNQDSVKRKEELIKRKNEFFKLETWQSVQKQLSPKSAAIEFMSYDYIDGMTFFYAIIIKPSGDPIYVHFPRQESLYSMLDRFDGQPTGVSTFYGYRTGESLYDLLWAPLSAYLNDMEEIFISPDGLLHKVNFPAIAGPDQTLLAERYRIRRILSSRFLNEANQQRPITTVSLFGGIDYETGNTVERKIKKGSKAVVIRSGNGDQVEWNFLEGTQVECQRIQQICKTNRITTRLYERKEATEPAFYQQTSLQDGYILHIASHGFTDLDLVRQNNGGRGLTPEKKVNSSSIDPLLRTGIVFAGANKVQPAQGVSPTDGIALGLEIAKQPFDQCELVVLSACETGLGEVKGKEGVFGLQKAFKQSGAKKIIASLWQVPDKQTAELFTIFYAKLFSLRSVSEALRAAQLEMKRKYDPYYWAGFMLLE